jgi:2-methylcitrate dehydratase PrpD
MTERTFFYTESLGEYVHHIDYSRIPENAIHACKLHILDTLGVALAGSMTPWAKIVADWAKGRSAPGNATILRTWEKTECTTAALVNGTFSHSLDYDDDPGLCHIGAVVVPASLAVGEEKRISGRELVTAVNVGYDVVTRVEEAFNGEKMFSRGFHPTAVCGVFGAAACASRITGLTSEETANALGIAGSFASGLMEFIADGSMTKRIHTGWAAQAGISAASLAARGFTGPKSIFEGKFGLRAYSGNFRGSKLLRDLGKRFDVLNSGLKKHPSCLYNAPAIDAILELVENGVIDRENVKRIDVNVRKAAFALVGDPIHRKQNPTTILDAQMSMPFCLASAVVDRELCLRQFSRQKISDRRILELARKVWVTADRKLDRLPPNNLTTIINIKLNDGRKIRRVKEHYYGEPCHPLSEEDVVRKFKECAGMVMKPEDTEQLARSILKVESVPDVAMLLDVFRSGPSKTIKSSRQ